jgi:hypothetical protein
MGENEDTTATDLAAQIASALVNRSVGVETGGVNGGGRHGYVDVRLANGQTFRVSVEEMF